jgi:beta-glucosidase
MELKGLNRLHLARGESRQVEFTITPEMLQMLDNNLKPVIEPGDFNIMIGASSKDIRLKEVLSIE